MVWLGGAMQGIVAPLCSYPSLQTGKPNHEEKWWMVQPGTPSDRQITAATPSLQASRTLFNRVRRSRSDGRRPRDQAVPY